MEVRFVSSELTCRYLGERVIQLKLFNGELSGGPGIIKTIDSNGPDAKVSNERVVAVPADRKQGGLGAPPSGSVLRTTTNR